METDNSTEKPKNDPESGIDKYVVPPGGGQLPEYSCIGAVTVRPVGSGVGMFWTTLPSQGMAPMHGTAEAWAAPVAAYTVTEAETWATAAARKKSEEEENMAASSPLSTTRRGTSDDAAVALRRP